MVSNVSAPLKKILPPKNNALVATLGYNKKFSYSVLYIHCILFKGNAAFRRFLLVVANDDFRLILDIFKRTFQSSFLLLTKMLEKAKKVFSPNLNLALFCVSKTL